MSLYNEMTCLPRDPLTAEIFAKCFSFLDSPGSRKIVADELEKFLKEHEACLNDFKKLTREAREAEEEGRKKSLEEESIFFTFAIMDIERPFCEVLDELHSKGVTLNSWQVSRLSRYDMPEEIKAKINLLKEETPRFIPEGERLSTPDAEALFTGLHNGGFINGEKSDFMAHFAKGTTELAKRYALVIEWLGKTSQLAYFIHLYSRLVNHNPGTATNREKAFCRIFGIDDKTLKNTIRPYLSEYHKEYYYKIAGMKCRKCRGGKEIEDILNTLPNRNVRQPKKGGKNKP